MDDLSKALGDIGSIRRQMARSTEFRGYGPATLAATALFSVAAACAQAMWLPDAAAHPVAYLGLWTGVAVVSGATIGVQMISRSHRMHSVLAGEMIRMAVEQFLPAIGVGAILTLVIANYAPQVLWMMPGLWQILSGLGIFSSCRFLPRAMTGAGVWYLAAGLFTVALADGRALSPWAMGIPFGVGQLLIAGVLYCNAQETCDEG
jgi:hypothetical protein